MPIRRIRRRRNLRKRAAKGRKMRKMRISKTLSSMNDRARVVEVENYGDIPVNLGQNLTWQLSLFPRALAVSKNFRYYRCAKVELEFIPYANVFAPGQSLPELYYQTDYTTALATAPPTQASMEGRGVTPVKWTSVIKRRFTPAVLRFENLQTMNALNVQYFDVQPLSATPVKNKWYMTQQVFNPTVQGTTQQAGPSADPTNLKYHGAAFFPNSPIGAGNVGRLVIKTHWDFKEPLVSTNHS